MKHNVLSVYRCPADFAVCCCAVRDPSEILSLYSQDQKRVEKVSKRANAIMEVKESVTLLSQLLQGYSKESCLRSNQDLVKVSTDQHIQTGRGSSKGHQSARVCVCVCFQDLYQRCEKMRPTLFRLASDTEDNDEALGELRPPRKGGSGRSAFKGLLLISIRSGYPAGQRQPDAGHQPVQTAGEGGGRVRGGRQHTSAQ